MTGTSAPLAAPQRLSAPPAASGVRAGGLPLAPEVAQAAVQWFVLLSSGEAGAQDRSNWQAWLGAHADHARAWQHLAAVTQALPGLNAGGAAYHGLTAAPRGRRRQLLGLATALVVAPTAWLAWRQQPWQHLQADYASGTGERRTVTLPDGTVLTLGTASRVVLHFNAMQRQVSLLAGEVMVATGHPGGALGERPFVVETEQGRIRPLGTRFSVRQEPAETRVAVLQGAVELEPQGGATPLRVEAGQAAWLRADAAHGLRAAVPGDTAWSQGLLVVENQRLDDFLVELGRYRRGWLRAHPAVAGLRLSGVFPLGPQADTDAVLALLPNSLPVQVRTRAQWWVVVEPQE
ncbi:FecR domain-containing protein [Acidovorax sp. sic0104]|uniref:FecR domain-containing protein n=1 Tax=Acidovorax sp. sic0104 TaxID=2854784 RepID=UPI001C43FFF0|nr:FecR domain-containing protein [Acidovorax sp. sic0104]MBV7539466.1 FecR domain-containing protein [Acidovorax sp. sic0104]